MAPVTATMSLIDKGLLFTVRDFFDVPQDVVAEAEAPVEVTLRLGPKMATRTFAIGRDGFVEPKELKKLRHMLRCRRSGRTHRLNQGLLEKVADLASHYQGHTIEVVSAFRYGQYAKPGSRHHEGRAIDIRVVGVPAARVRDYLWARYASGVGVGFYKEQQFIHLDHRRGTSATAWTQKHHSDSNEYNPKWSRASRRDKLVVALAGVAAE